MEIPTEELLIKFSREPGLMTVDEILKVHAWLNFIQPHVERYKAIYGAISGDSVNGMIDRSTWYLHYHLRLVR